MSIWRPKYSLLVAVGLCLLLTHCAPPKVTPPPEAPPPVSAPAASPATAAPAAPAPAARQTTISARDMNTLANQAYSAWVTTVGVLQRRQDLEELVEFRSKLNREIRRAQDVSHWLYVHRDEVTNVPEELGDWATSSRALSEEIRRLLAEEKGIGADYYKLLEKVDESWKKGGNVVVK